jgi:3-deoxy-D-manno-octulosonate 8-phosphate phosphatase (KDO 8-P phosphatase)
MKKIKYIVLDVDGTLTDGGIYLDSQGLESKRFCVQDGAGILVARQAGIEAIILTGRKSICVEKRAKELAIKNVYQDIKNKKLFLEEFMIKYNLYKEEMSYCGDDLNDIAAMKLCGLIMCPNNAAKEVKNICDYIADTKGGNGAVRECIEFILKKTGEWNQVYKKLFSIED